MEQFEDTSPEELGRVHRVARELFSLIKAAGQGFAENNRGLELSSREDRLVGVMQIPDYIPSDWQA